MSNKPVHLTPKAGLLNNIEVFEKHWLLEIIWKLLAQVTGTNPRKIHFIFIFEI
jgi:hypothetical protein